MNEIEKLRRIHQQLLARGVDKYYHKTEDIGRLLSEIDTLLGEVTKSNKNTQENTNVSILHGGKFSDLD